MNNLLIQNVRIYRDGVFTPGEILCQEGKIAKIAPDIDAPEGTLRLDGTGRRLVPGFMDIHTHGAAGVDVNAASAQELGKIGRFFASQGVTGWLASVLTDTREQTLWCIGEVKKAMEHPEGAPLLGVHLEGPFLASSYKGAMPEELLQTGNAALLREYLGAGEGAVRYVTVSPEVPGVVEMIEEVSGEVTVAIGHSGADYEISRRAIAAGAKAATHTGNAMRLLHQHEPAIWGAVLEDDRVFCEVICDGRHLHPGTVRLILKTKGMERVVAITDSIMAAGLPDGPYKLGVNDVIVQDGDAKLPNGTRAGSTLTLINALKNLVAFTGLPVEQLLPLLTRNPAQLLGLSEQKGAIAPGMDADLVLLGEDLTVDATIAGGKVVYKA